jgi:hypothetical protein
MFKDAWLYLGHQLTARLLRFSCCFFFVLKDHAGVLWLSLSVSGTDRRAQGDGDVPCCLCRRRFMID